jgi:hypothetical protein
MADLRAVSRVREGVRHEAAELSGDREKLTA